MTADDDVLRAAYSLAGTEIRSVLKNRDRTEAIDRDEARQEITTVLLQAARQRDIDAILALERILLSAEREYLGEAPKKVASLNNGLEELDAALLSLASVREQDSYREIANRHYSLSKNQIGGLPRDQARQFFRSHQTRFRNLEKGRMEDSERALLSVRAGNIKIAETVYRELQQQALGIEDLTGANP